MSVPVSVSVPLSKEAVPTYGKDKRSPGGGSPSALDPGLKKRRERRRRKRERQPLTLVRVVRGCTPRARVERERGTPRGERE